MTAYSATRIKMLKAPRKWLVTGVAGFIGSNLLETLLRLDQQVVGLDNFSTGSRKNLEDVKAQVHEDQWRRFELIEGDIRHLSTCDSACKDVDLVLHQAALVSVPLSIEEPLECHQINITGSLNMLKAARDNQVKRMVYASSSAVYGDNTGLPKVEDIHGKPLSPYAVSKMVNELQAHLFSELYGLDTIGLRYFNVFGPRQDAFGAYAAVIPNWVSALCSDQPVCIYGTGETSRDFCYIDNVVQANLLAALTSDRSAVNQVYNVALNRRTTLNELYQMLYARVTHHNGAGSGRRPVYRQFRQGDILHSQADISKAQNLLGYEPTHTVEHGLDAAMGWYLRTMPHPGQDAA